MDLKNPLKNYRDSKHYADAELPTKLEQSVRNICEKEGFIEYTIDKKCVSTDGGNYLSILYEIDVKGGTNDGDKEINLFAKHVIYSENVKIFTLSDIYANEMFVYKELSQMFTDLQEQANVPLEERYKIIKLYEESSTEVIIMENVAKQGFTKFYRMEEPPLNFFEISVKQLARFHGLSFVIREKKPEFFIEKIKPLKCPYHFHDNFIDMVKKLKNECLKYVDDKFKDKLQKAYGGLYYRYGQYCNDENLNVCLSHGDYRNCNIMVKIQDGKIQELIPVDYQLLYYGCPVFDFLYLIFIGTDRQFRKQHLTYLKDLYYETLSGFLGYFDLDVDNIYPRVEFERVYREKLDFGLLSAILLLPFVFASENDVPDFSQLEMQFHVDERIKNRLQGVVEEYIEWGLL